jgi:hypothetical protein
VDRPHRRKGDIRCEIVVNAAGYYAQRVAEWFRSAATVPMAVMSHQYLVFEEVPDSRAWSKEAGHKLPLLRDVDVSYYLRQEKHGFNLGPYERNCRAHWVTPDDPMPEDFSFQLFPDDLDRLEPYIADAMARVPVLARRACQGHQRPDPLRARRQPADRADAGRAQRLRGLRLHLRHRQAGGAGKVLAEWVTEGETEWDMWSCDPRRFTDFTDPDYCVAKAWRSTATNTRCTSPPPLARGARPQALARPRPHKALGGRWAPMAAGSAPTGSRSRATTRRRKPPRPGAAPARGSRASARNARRCATPWASSTCPASRAST